MTNMASYKNVGVVKASGNRFEWTIHDFFSMPLRINEFIASKEFRFRDKLFRLGVCRSRSTDAATDDWMGIHLLCRNLCDLCEYTAQFSIRKRNGEQTEISGVYNASLAFFHFFNYTQYQCATLVRNKEELVPDGHLTILCSLKKTGDEAVKVKSGLNEAADVSLNQPKNDAAVQTTEQAVVSSVTSEYKDAVALRDGFEAMYYSGEFCDFDVKVQDRVFRTHKMLLAARSSGFASMLSLDMKEKTTGMVEIVDCDSNTFEDFLKFLYGGKNDIIVPENVVGLYEVANKYDVQNLKSECRRFMMENLSVELFCDVLCLALKHDEKELIKRATEYFKLNKKNIFLSVKWQIFLHENTTYGNELLIKTCD